MFTVPKTNTIREIQRNYKKIFEQVKKTKQPVIVVKNNKPDVAVVDVQTFEAMSRKLEEFEIEKALRSVKLGMKEDKLGKTKTFKSLARLDSVYWQNLWRLIEQSRSLKGKKINTSKFISEDHYKH